MALSLSKGGNLSLTKEAPGMTKVLVGLGWDARSTDGQGRLRRRPKPGGLRCPRLPSSARPVPARRKACPSGH